jgi:hypothetical protein
MDACNHNTTFVGRGKIKFSETSVAAKNIPRFQLRISQRQMPWGRLATCTYFYQDQLYNDTIIVAARLGRNKCLGSRCLWLKEGEGVSAEEPRGSRDVFFSAVIWVANLQVLKKKTPRTTLV